MLRNLAFCRVNIVGEILKLAKLRQHGFIAKTDGVHIDVQRAFDAPPAGVAHAAPVLERIADERIRWDRRNRLVPVLHLHRRQRNINHIAVGTILGHLDPVAQMDHIVRRYLNARDKAEDRVLKDQHQHRRHRPKAGQNTRRIPADNHAEDNNAAGNKHDDFDHLHKPANRHPAGKPVCAVNVDHAAEERIDDQHPNDDHINKSRHLHEPSATQCVNEDDRRGLIDNNRRNQMGQ